MLKVIWREGALHRLGSSMCLTALSASAGISVCKTDPPVKILDIIQPLNELKNLPNFWRTQEQRVAGAGQ